MPHGGPELKVMASLDGPNLGGGLIEQGQEILSRVGMKGHADEANQVLRRVGAQGVERFGGEVVTCIRAFPQYTRAPEDSISVQ